LAIYLIAVILIGLNIEKLTPYEFFDVLFSFFIGTVLVILYSNSVNKTTKRQDQIDGQITDIKLLVEHIYERIAIHQNNPTDRTQNSIKRMFKAVYEEINLFRTMVPPGGNIRKKDDDRILNNKIIKFKQAIESPTYLEQGEKIPPDEMMEIQSRKMALQTELKRMNFKLYE
jgi:hypothetical protein